MSIFSIKRFLTAARSFVCTRDKNTGLIQEQQALLTGLLRYDRFTRITQNDLKADLIALQAASAALKEICEQLHKDLTPAAPYKGGHATMAPLTNKAHLCTTHTMPYLKI